MKKRDNYLANNNADNEFINAKESTENDEGFHIPVDPRVQSWDPTPDTCEEMVNTYGTYEIQPTADSKNMFPAISQGLPSEEVAHRPEHFHEGVVPQLRDR